MDLHRGDRTECHLSDEGAEIQLNHAVPAFLCAPRNDLSDGCHPSHDMYNITIFNIVSLVYKNRITNEI